LLSAKLRCGGPDPYATSFATKEVPSGTLSKARLVLRDRDEQRKRAEASGGGVPVDNLAGIMNGTVRLDGAYAEAIRVLGRRVVGDTIEIGNRPIAVKARLPHGQWLRAGVRWNSMTIFMSPREIPSSRMRVATVRRRS
jgi:hypothetical protein